MGGGGGGASLFVSSTLYCRYTSSTGLFLGTADYFYPYHCMEVLRSEVFANKEQSLLLFGN